MKIKAIVHQAEEGGYWAKRRIVEDAMFEVASNIPAVCRRI